MKTTFIFALYMALTVVASPALAQTYQWKNSSGQTVISDTPPTGSGQTTWTLANSNAAVEPKTFAEKDLEFKKRQQEAKEKAELATKERAIAADKQENCSRAQRNLLVLESEQAVQSVDANGQRVTMDTSQRNQEIIRARRFIAETCK